MKKIMLIALLMQISLPLFCTACVGALNVAIGKASTAYNNDMSYCANSRISYLKTRCEREAQLSYHQSIDNAVDKFYVCDPSWQ